MTNINNDFNLFFEKHAAWAICNARMMDAISFFLTNVELKQLGLVTLFMTLGGCFAPGPPFCKICNSAPFYVNMCVACMYYVVHKQENLTRIVIHLGTHDHLVAKGRS
jgi:hypothetical protein